MEGGIAPGAEAFEAEALNFFESGLGAMVDVGWFVFSVPVLGGVMDCILLASFLLGLDGGDGVEKLERSRGGNEPPDTGLIFAKAPEAVLAAELAEGAGREVFGGDEGG